MKIGFIGTGIMGKPMAGHLLKAGHEIFVVKHRSAPSELIQAGAKLCAMPEDVARAADMVITMLPDTPQVERVLFGAHGVCAGLDAGKTVIDMSSIDPMATKSFAAKLAEAGCFYADAPVSGGEVGAKAAALTIMVGAEPETFEKIEPILKLMGKNITLIGAPGAGQIAKVANQIIVALNIEAVSEALVFASKAGVDPAKVREALMGGFAASRILEVHGERMIKRTFTPGARISMHQKDLTLALNQAKAMGLSLPSTAIAQQLFSACVAQGGSDWDHSAMVKAIETLANHKLG
jgi:2-hydroxy-3-oxopropionate reductase